MKLLHLLVVCLSVCIIAAVPTSKPCDKSLLIDNNGCHTLFELEVKNGQGVTCPDALKSLKYSGSNGWTKAAVENEIFVFTFTLLESCSEKWEIYEMGIITKFVKQMTLTSENVVLYPWTINDYSVEIETNTLMRKTLTAQEFKLTITAAAGDMLVKDLHLKLFCNCMPTTTPLDIVEPTSTPKPVTVGPCDTTEYGKVKYDGDCTKYIQCIGKKPYIKSCTSYTYFDPAYTGNEDCIDKTKLTPERKAECKLV